MSGDLSIALLTEIRNCVRAASYSSIKSSLQEALPDEKSRAIYQMLDGKNSVEQIRIACKASPNAVVLLAQTCVSMGLMEAIADKKKVRLFDLTDFGLISTDRVTEEKAKK